MLTLFTGLPGAGKTASMLDLVMRELSDRPLFVHFDESERVRPDQKLLAETLQLPHTRCNARSWFDEVPDGAVLLIDEAQGAFRPRGSGSAVPKAIQAFETHRHAGIDVFMTTQGPKLVDSNLRSLIGRHVHIRDTGWMGRWWYEWDKCDTELRLKTCENKRRYTLPKKVFEVYRSANEHTKVPRKIPPLVFLCAGAIVIAAGLLLYMFGGKKPDEKQLQKLEPAQAVSAPAAAHQGQSVQPAQVYDYGEFIPRVSHRPETAPAFDELRKVVVMPTVIGGVCKKKTECVCFTQQGTDAGLSPKECGDWMNKRPFDPYTLPPPPVQQVQKPAQQSAAAEPAPASLPLPAAPSRPSGEVTLSDVTRAAKTGRLNELGRL